MDERHWWIAGKIQETFHMGAFDNPTLLEDFLCENDTLDLINQFFSPGGPCRIFVYCQKSEGAVTSVKELHITETLADLREMNLEDVTILYLLRHNVDTEVEGGRIDKYIYSGDLKGNAIEILQSMIGEIYLPLMKSQKDWEQCQPDNQQNLLINLDKVMSNLAETSTGPSSSKHVMLRLPDSIVGTDFKQHRLAAADQSIITEYEELVSDWMTTIEAILHDTSDERFMDPNAGPLSELDRWRRRQRLLTSITEQLKGKECKTVIGVLITGKSRLLKKWKVIDSGITDAMNDTKDKVRYLESLKRPLEQLYHGATPASIMSQALPTLMHSVKQMDSVSRFYARQGFLGLLFTKVTNQLVLACKEYLQQCTQNYGSDDEDLLWQRVQEEIQSRSDASSPAAGPMYSSSPAAPAAAAASQDPQTKQLQSQLNAKLNKGGPAAVRGAGGRKPGAVAAGGGDVSETLYNRLRQCLTLQTFYRDSIRSLRDALGASQNLSHFTSLSSLTPQQGGGANNATSSVGGKGKLSARELGTSSKQTTHHSISSSPSKKASVSGDEGHGVSVADEETILSHMEAFCNRLRQILDVINTMSQFNGMIKTAVGLPRPRKEDLVVDESKEKLADAAEQESEEEIRQSVGMALDQEVSVGDLAVIDEGEEVLIQVANERRKAADKGPTAPNSKYKGPPQAPTKGLSRRDVELLRKHYPDNKAREDSISPPSAQASYEEYKRKQESKNKEQWLMSESHSFEKYYFEIKQEEGPSVAEVVKEHLDKMTSTMTEHVTTKTILDVESKDKDRFEDIYTAYLWTGQELERFVAAYLHALFMRKMKSHEALNLMQKFAPISQRPGVRVVISEKFIEIFNWYEADLEAIQDIYEKHKANPPNMRNAPPVAGAIQWSRQLLHRIEEPMKVFRENKAVTHLKDFGRIVKLYNRLATVLVTFESLWFQQWKNQSIEEARCGLRATLLVLHPRTGHVIVNADEKVLELIQEAKWLKRLNIAIPESAEQVLAQEARFKSYKDHLELCLKEFTAVQDSIPGALKELFQAHVDSALQNFQPGLNTLAWNSMNIDAFLHQLHTGTTNLKYLVERVNNVLEHRVHATIAAIKDMIFFDYKMAFSKRWPAQDFMMMMAESIQERSDQLYRYITTIENAIKECAHILTIKRRSRVRLYKRGRRSPRRHSGSPDRSDVDSPRRGSPRSKSACLGRLCSMSPRTKPPCNRAWSPRSKRNKKKKKYATRLDVYPSFKSHVALPDPSLPKMETVQEKGGKGQGSREQRPTAAASSDQQSSKEHHDIIASLLENYSDEIYGAVLLASTRSLVTLAESSGCDGESIRAASRLSEAPSSNGGLGSRRESIASRPGSVAVNADVSRSRPISILSMLSNMTWTTERTEEITYLQFEVLVKFSIPTISLDPALKNIQNALTAVARDIMKVPKGVRWLGGDNLGEEFMEAIQEDEVVDDIQVQLAHVVKELEETVKSHLFHFSMYDFLWKDDMYGNYSEFIQAGPQMREINKEVDRLLSIEKKVLNIPAILPVGPVCLLTDPIKDALHGFAMAWKNQYASVLHEEAKRKLDSAVQYRSTVRGRLELHVQNLDQLNSTLQLLEELGDMENKVDDIYLPIENMYTKLREFELRLPRAEVEEVDELRVRWQELLDLAQNVNHTLLKERRSAFEQELDKQVKGFVVEVIQFRNAFDAQGPAVPGISPSEAVERLHNFQHRYALYDAKRKTLDSVSKLFGIPCKGFPELDKTGEELELLGNLYGLFQKFLRFDDRFRDTLWAEVDLDSATREVESYWDECLALPSKLKDWDAYNDMKGSIQQYRDVFPLLHKLAARRVDFHNVYEIRNRHWLQVMAVTGSSFQLEANVFKLSHLLDIGLIKNRAEMEEICRSASRELELEIKLRMTEEEWTEQVLNFEHYKKRGPMFLDKTFTERLLEQLEDAQALLAQMLTSRYIGPLREEAAAWAEKLKEVGEVLEIWLEVQDLWHYLEAVFSNENTAKELPQEAKRFARIDKGWTKMMKRAYDTRNVLQCCYGEEVPKGVVLRHIYAELEICFKSLTGYLDNKRRTFPRFFFVTDPILLAILSRPNDLDSVRPHLKSVFAAISDVKLEKQDLDDLDSDLHDHNNSLLDTGGRRSSVSNDRSRNASAMSHFEASTPPPKIDKRLTQHHLSPSKSRRGCASVNPAISMHAATMLPSEMTLEDRITMQAVAVSGSAGEIMPLQEPVALVGGVESWLTQIHSTVKETLGNMLLSLCTDIAGEKSNNLAPEEWVIKFSSQICRTGLLSLWTRECEQGITELRYDRKALSQASKRFGVVCSRLAAVAAKGSWRNIEIQEPFSALHRLRLEGMIAPSLFLRDMIDSITQRKLRENTDFEWRRCLRLYLHEKDGSPKPVLYMLDEQYTYGCEFYGSVPMPGLTPMTDKAYLSMSQALAGNSGAMLSGQNACGKTETVKGFAQNLGRYLMLFQCAAKSDPASLSKVVQGLAMDGCWGCFDDIQDLSKEGLAVFLDHCQSILTALKNRSMYCYIGDSQELSLSPDTGLFLTYQPSGRPNDIPVNLRAMFRQVALLPPDLSLVLKAKCAALQFKSPATLALRLKLVAELVKDQLPDEPHHNFSIAALSSVLLRANQRKRASRESAKGDRQEKTGRSEEKSRSNSEMSVAPTAFPVLQQEKMPGTSGPTVSQSNTASVGHNSAGQDRKETDKFDKVAGKGNIQKAKAGTPNPLSQVAKQEHALVGQAIVDIIGPRLTLENQAILKQVVKDVFAGLPDGTGRSGNVSAYSRTFDLEAAVEATATEAGLVPHKPWVEKCMQLYQVAQVNQGIIVAGPPGSGKSTIIQSLVDALCVSPRGMSRASNRTANTRTAGTDISDTNHKLQKLFPLVVDDLSLIFGHLNHNHDWVDGIFTSAWKKASRNQSTTWLCMDGPLNASWVDQFGSVLDPARRLTLANGDQLFLSSNVKLLFETHDLSSASPAIVARSGVVFVDQQVVGWRPVAKAWLENRSQQEVHVISYPECLEDSYHPYRVLQRAFNKTVDPITHYVLNDCKPRLQLSEMGMFNTCMNMLSAMLADNIEIGGELHIERLYLFCLMWSYGGLLDEKDTKGFNDLLGTLSTALPDDDRDICFFDYYVDESGEWDPWQSRVPEAVYQDSHNLLGEVFVDTVDTIRTRLLMDFAYGSGQNVVLVGPPGCGKTAMVNDFIDTQDPQAQVTKKLVYSGSSNARQLQSYIEANIYHRQGFVYGAKEGKRLQLVIDDVNLPTPDEYGVQRCNELLRRMLDDKVLCTVQKPFEWRTVEGLTVLATLTMNEFPSVQDRLLHSRLLRHFAVFHLPGAHGEGLKSIVNGILESSMLWNEHPGLGMELHDSLVKASCHMLSQVVDVLRPTPMPGRRHYFFTLKDIVTCFQCVKRLADEARTDEKLVVSLWRHELLRIMKDRICRFADQRWFDDTLNETIKTHWPDLADDLHQHFVTFPTGLGRQGAGTSAGVDAATRQGAVSAAPAFQRPATSAMSRKEVRVALAPVASLRDVHACLQAHLNAYNEEFGNVFLDINLSENIILHVLKMHRVLSYHHGGNLLLVGPIGSHLGTLCKLALHVADLDTHPIDTSKQNTFFDGLRSAVRMTGSEGKTLTLCFDARDLRDDLYLDAINSLLISGEYPHLFTNDEMEGLLLALGPAMKREYPSVTVDPAKFFVSRVKTNLHILINLHPRHHLLDMLASHYPGLLAGGQMMWITDWGKDALLGEASYCLNKCQVMSPPGTNGSSGAGAGGGGENNEALLEAVVTCMANIHSFVLHDCRQTKWAGDISEEITVTQVGVHEKKKDTLKTKTFKTANLPFSKVVLLENIKLRHRNLHIPTPSELYVGPTTYRRFMDTFKHLFTIKAQERTTKVNMLKKVIATMDQTRKDARKMKENIKGVSREYEEAKDKTTTLMSTLTHRATVLEKLKAKVGIATALSAFLQLNELSDEEEEDEDLLKEEERDEYDDEFDRMREANLKTRQVQAKEEYETAVKTCDTCRTNLAHAKKQVEYWKGKVDRQCIERLKNFQNPPMLVGHVMEMVMTLIGKKSISKSSEHYPRGDEQSGRYSASSGSTKYTIGKKDSPMYSKSKESVERFDRAAWKSMQQTMNESSKFVDMMHNVPWEDGLSKDIVGAVESYLAKSRDGQLGVTGEGSMLDNAQEKERSFVPQRRSPSPENTKGITIAAAKYSSEDAATLLNYTIAIVEYTRLCGPLRAAMDRMTELQREIDENQRLQKEKEQALLPEEDREKAEEAESRERREQQQSQSVEDEGALTEEDLPRIQDEVNVLQAEFDNAVVAKHSLEMELLSMKERLKAASDLMDSLKTLETEWRAHVNEYATNDVLVANCVAASAFLVYCGAMNTDMRRRMGDFFMTICEHHGLPLGDKQLFRNQELVNFLYSGLGLQELQQLRLPMTRLMLENAVFIMQGDNTLAWPLLSDPTSRVCDWIECYHSAETTKSLVTVKYSEVRSQFDTCLAEGLPLLITDVDVDLFVRDQRFIHVLISRNKFIAGKHPFKIAVGDHDVECAPDFRLFLHTSTAPHRVPPELAAHVNIIFFHAARPDIEEELLDRFMTHEKARINDERQALTQERVENQRYLEHVEEQMMQCLASEVRLLQDLTTTKRLTDLIKQYDEKQDSQSKIAVSETSILRGRDGYRVIARRGAVCFDACQYLREINPTYCTAWSRFLSLYDAAIAHSDRASIKAVIDRLTHAAFTSTVRSLMERDRMLYQLLLGIEVEDAEGRVGPGEREYLISPALGSVTMTSLGFNQPADSKFVTAKKPFDWMSDDSFNNLQILAIHYEWFQEMFDRMPKDGRETQWRTMCESDAPESAILPDKMDDHYTPLQRFLVIRAVRADRLMHLATLFISSVLGKKYVGEAPLDMSAVLRQAGPETPVLVLYLTERLSAEQMVHHHAQKRHQTLLTLHLSGTGPAEEKQARKLITKARNVGAWLLLQNGHNCPSLLLSLETLLAPDQSDSVDSAFRCWVTAEASEAIPARLLQTACRIMADTPKTMKDGLVRAFTSMDSDILRQNTRSEWPPLLHNVCYLHAAIKLRARFQRGGWNCPYDFLHIGNNQLQEALTIVSNEMRDSLGCTAADGSPTTRTTSWTGIRFMLAEMVYGSFLSDQMDQTSLAAMVDYWISPNAVKKDFELPRLKYKMPQTFFSSNPRLAQLVQGLDNIGQHQLEAPEAGNIFPSSETILGDDQYVFTRLNRVYDAIPASSTLSHQLFPRAPTPFDVPPVANVSHGANHPGVVNQGMFASASFAALRMKKEVELWEVCHTAISKVPKAYSKEYVTERIKKIGGFTSFNIYIMRELELMYGLINEVKHTLTAIKAACEVNMMGDQLTPHQLSAADDLYHLRLPSVWLHMSRGTAPPPNQALATWLTDLSNRCQHLEKILVLGREKMPAYWLGAFFYPRGLLALLKQDAYRHYNNDRSGNIDNFVFHTEITSRDKDHIRDPPAEGMFVFGIYLWGVAWEKTTGELLDAPPRQTCASLPVIHLTCWPASDKPSHVGAVDQKPSEVYSCPVYHSRHMHSASRNQPILEIELQHSGIPASRWSLRGLSGTVRPY